MVKKLRKGQGSSSGQIGPIRGSEKRPRSISPFASKGKTPMKKKKVIRNTADASLF